MENLTYEQILDLFAKTDEKIRDVSEQLRESGLRLDERFAKTDERSAKTDEKINKVSAQIAVTNQQISRLEKKVGEITDTLGRFAEAQVRPKILELFRQKGIILEEAHYNVHVEKDGRYLLELDLLLVNTIYSVAVEVKHTLRESDIDDHLERLAKLKDASSRSIKGTTMYGAIAGMIVTKEVEKYAAKKGFYVVKPSGDGVEISNIENFVPKAWIVGN